MKFDLCNDLWEKFTDTKKIEVYLKYRKRSLMHQLQATPPIQ